MLFASNVLKIYFSFILIALSSNEVQASSSICEGLLKTFKSISIELRHGTDAEKLWSYINFNNSIHPSSEVRDVVFRALVKHPKFLHKNSSVDFVLKVLSEYAPEEVSALSHWMIEDGFPIDSNFYNWARNKFDQNLWIREALSKKYISIEGRLVERAFFSAVRKARRELRDRGIMTRFVHMKNERGEARGILLIDRITRKANAIGNVLDPILSHSKLEEFLQVARDQYGAVAIDLNLEEEHPDSKTLAYFKLNGEIPGRKWMIGIRRDTPLLLMEHEWQHKVDFHDALETYHSELVSKSFLDRKKFVFFKRLRDYAIRLETKHFSEINATNLELELLNQLPVAPKELVLSAMQYRAINMLKVAVGRILLEPLNIEHYKLLLEGIAFDALSQED